MLTQCPLCVRFVSALCPLCVRLCASCQGWLHRTWEAFDCLPCCLQETRFTCDCWLVAPKKTEPKREWQRLTFKFSTIKCSTDSSLWYSVIGWAEYEIKSHAFPYHNIPHTFEGFPSPTVPWWLLACLWHRPPALLCPVVPPPGPKELLTREKLTRDDRIRRPVLERANHPIQCSKCFRFTAWISRGSRNTQEDTAWQRLAV